MSVASAGSVEMGIGGPSSRVSEGTGLVLKYILGTGGKKTTSDTTAETTVDSTQRTSQEILGNIA